MAARTDRVKLSEEWRERIRLGMLVDRLQKQALGELETPMTREEIRAAEILLKKSLPDLQATTHSGDPDNPLVTGVNVWLGNRRLDSSEAGTATPAVPVQDPLGG